MNPFKNVEDFESEINIFLAKHKAFLIDQGKRISDYFEMSCYNKIVRYYQSQNFTIHVKNLINNSFKYKLSPSGYPDNFSYFEIIKKGEGLDHEKIYTYEIHHNLTVQSGHQEDIYLTPDISIVNSRSIISDHEHYMVARSTKKFCYVKNESLQTFCEVKNFTPFPELLYNFMGQYNELKGNAITENLHTHLPYQIAPCLLISGKGNEHTLKIKKSLERRYKINIVFDLFERSYIHSSNVENQILSLKYDLIDIKDYKVLDETIITDELPF